MALASYQPLPGARMPNLNTVPNQNGGRHVGIGAATHIHGSAVADKGQVQILAACLPDPLDNLIAMNAHRLRVQDTLPQPFHNYTIPLVMPAARQGQLPTDRQVPFSLGLDFPGMAQHPLAPSP